MLCVKISSLGFIHTSVFIDRKNLEAFLSCDMSSSDEVFDKFLLLLNAQRHEYLGCPYCVYVPDKRPDRILLTAQANTVFRIRRSHRVKFSNGKYISLEPEDEIGADDRAGCVILWQLRDSVYSLLITNDEEIGCKGVLAIYDSLTGGTQKTTKSTIFL